MTACRFFCEFKPQRTAKRFQRGLPLLFYEFCGQQFPTISVNFSIYPKKGTPEYACKSLYKRINSQRMVFKFDMSLMTDKKCCLERGIRIIIFGKTKKPSVQFGTL